MKDEMRGSPDRKNSRKDLRGLVGCVLASLAITAATFNGLSGDTKDRTNTLQSVKPTVPSSESTSRAQPAEATKTPVARFPLTPEQRSKIDALKDDLLQEYTEGYTGTDEYTGTDTYGQLVSRHYSANGKGMIEVSAVVRNGSEGVRLEVARRGAVVYEGGWATVWLKKYKLPIESTKAASLTSKDALTTEELEVLLWSDTVKISEIEALDQATGYSDTVINIHEDGTFSVEVGLPHDYSGQTLSAVTNYESALADMERALGTSLE